MKHLGGGRGSLVAGARRHNVWIGFATHVVCVQCGVWDIDRPSVRTARARDNDSLSMDS